MLSEERVIKNRTQPVWEQFRQQMPVTKNWAYFDHAAVAPITLNAQKKLKSWADAAAENAMFGWQEWRTGAEKVRESGARLLGADTDEVAFVHSTTEGINFVVDGFPWQPGDNVVTLAGEFPTNYIPWRELKSEGVELRVLRTERGRITPAEIANAMDERTRLVTLSWVNYVSGWKHNLAAIAEVVHRRGVLLLVDAIQGLGVLPIDVHEMGIDFLAADGHKWLLGPEGAGLFYVKREHLNLLRPMMVGWDSVGDTWNFENLERPIKNTAARYEGGTSNFGLIAAMGESLDLLLQIGIENIEQRLLALNEQLRVRLERIGGVVLSPKKFEHRSGIVSVQFDQQPALQIQKQCRQAGVLVNSRGGAVRVSPHIYTNADEIERLIEAVEFAVN